MADVPMKRSIARAGLALVLSWLLLPSAAVAEPVCAHSAAAQPALRRLGLAMEQGRFIGYQPTMLKVFNGHATRADAASIRADLAVLRPRFDALVTYGALNGAEEIPAAATALGFRAVIVGVWNPFDEAEVAAALEAVRRFPALVVGISLGNEMLFSGHRTAEAIERRIVAVRARAPGIPLATTEPFHVLYPPAARGVLGELDFLLANVHPVFQPWFRTAPDANAASFVVAVVDKLAELYCGPILVKETGVPTAPTVAGFTPARQAAFYGELRRHFAPTPSRAFVYFVAFDAPWRVADEQAAPGVHPEEAHWGLYDEHRKPKPVVGDIPLLASPPAG